jgi:hypothetical protein
MATLNVPSPAFGPFPPANVRVLHGDHELAEAVARAAVSAKRLDDRLAARAARDAWMAEHTEQRVGWLRFVRNSVGGKRLVIGDDLLQWAATPRRASPSSPAA